jgi:predicted site-specific integrase-resolvase
MGGFYPGAPIPAKDAMAGAGRGGLTAVRHNMPKHRQPCYSHGMKLSQWAKHKGISYKTAWRMWRDGRLPVHAEQLPTGTVVIHLPAEEAGAVALYARVSGADQKADLERQLARLDEYAISQNMLVCDRVKEIASGMNGHRKGLTRLLSNPEVKVVIVEHRDRLARFGFEYIEAALAAQGRKIVVVEANGVDDDVVRDLHEVIVSICARLYGRRSAKHRADQAVQALHG